jgi:2-polyprenyl-6-methoxyphenol hydroxylase-like FAD-dependent oxidoreductase
MAQGIVIGAGIAGLLAAQALATNGWAVTVLEKDNLAPHPSLRKGTPQAAHAHMLLKQGLDTIEHMAPGFTSRLINAGGISANMGRDWRTTLQSGTLIRGASRLDFISASRQLIEHTLRSIIDQNPNVTILDNARVDTVALSKSSPPSIQYTRRAQCSTISDIDLLVDASGRGSRIKKWLHENGFEAASEVVTQTGLGYASCRFRDISLPPGDAGWSCMYRAPDIPYGGVIMPVENGEYVVTLSGLNDNDPPSDMDGFINFSGKLQCARFRDALETGIAVSSIQTFRKPVNFYRRFNRLKHWPKNVVAVGDSVCSFNPVYGQGMSAAALAALAISQHLRSHRSATERSIQSKINGAYITPWLIAKTEDQRWASSQNVLARSTHHLMDKINRAGIRDAKVAEDFLSVLHMTRNPVRLLSPRTLIKAIVA